MRNSIPPEQGGAPDEPPPRRPRIPFASPRWGAPIIGVSVNSSIYPVFTHWTGTERTRCPGPNACLHCSSYGWLRIWSAYVLIRSKLTPQQGFDLARQGLPVTGALTIAEITWGAQQYRTWYRQPALGWNWRGMGIKLERMGKTKCAPVKLTLFPGAALDADLPAEYDITAHLLGRWPLSPGAGERRPEGEH